MYTITLSNNWIDACNFHSLRSCLFKTSDVINWAFNKPSINNSRIKILYHCNSDDVFLIMRLWMQRWCDIHTTIRYTCIHLIAKTLSGKKYKLSEWCDIMKFWETARRPCYSIFVYWYWRYFLFMESYIFPRHYDAHSV